MKTRTNRLLSGILGVCTPPDHRISICFCFVSISSNLSDVNRSILISTYIPFIVSGQDDSRKLSEHTKWGIAGQFEGGRVLVKYSKVSRL